MKTTELNDEFKNIVAELKKDGHKVDGHLVVAHDGHATNKLKDRPNIWLVVVLPSKTYEGREDSYSERNTIMLFILEKDNAGQSDQKEVEQYQKLEDVLRWVIEYMAETKAEGCSPFNKFAPTSITVDPEYRVFGGWNGWSLTVSF